MLNKVILAGNLTRDVELRYLPSGAALATIGLAVNRRFKKQDGSQGEEVCFIDVKLFGRTAEVANQYLRRGSKVLIEGRLVFESWTDNSGQKRSRHSVSAESMQMLGGGGTEPRDSGNYNNGGYTQGGGQGDYYQNSGGYNNGGYAPKYEAQGQQNYNQNYNNQGYNAKSNPQNQPKEEELPVIDINDEEIPF